MAIHHILVVDDSRTELVYLTSILKQHGYVVRTAENSEEAMQRLKEAVPDLILMDVVMPGMNGFQLTRSIKHNPDYANIPVVMCTSKDQPTDKFWGLRQGASDYLTKPVAAEDLLAKISILGKQ